jgi:hypothetical protein
MPIEFFSPVSSTLLASAQVPAPQLIPDVSRISFARARIDIVRRRKLSDPFDPGASLVNMLPLEVRSGPWYQMGRLWLRRDALPQLRFEVAG